MTQPQTTPFDPNTVQINFVLSPAQVGLILKGLGKLPLEEIDQLYHGIRQVAENTIGQAAQAAQEAAAKAAEPKPEPNVGPAPEREAATQTYDVAPAE